LALPHMVNFIKLLVVKIFYFFGEMYNSLQIVNVMVRRVRISSVHTRTFM
jgi:hypothetical protein